MLWPSFLWWDQGVLCEWVTRHVNRLVHIFLGWMTVRTVAPWTQFPYGKIVDLPWLAWMGEGGKGPWWGLHRNFCGKRRNYRQLAWLVFELRPPSTLSSAHQVYTVNASMLHFLISISYNNPNDGISLVEENGEHCLRQAVSIRRSSPTPPITLSSFSRPNQTVPGLIPLSNGSSAWEMWAKKVWDASTSLKDTYLLSLMMIFQQSDNRNTWDVTLSNCLNIPNFLA